MKSILCKIGIVLLAFTLNSTFAGELKWSGARIPAKISAGDGVTKLGTKIGTFLTPTNAEDVAQIVFNVNNRLPGTHPWTTLAVKAPDAAPIAPDVLRNILLRMDELGVDIFLEIYPRKTNDVLASLDAYSWVASTTPHKCIKGFCVDLEYYKAVTDDAAKAWDEKIKSRNASYRLALKHWEQNFMPPTYRGKGDLIFIDTSSESSIEELNSGFVDWANHFAPTAVAFQFGYPADEDGMNGSNTNGWWKLKDPVKDWSESLVSKINNPKQELGILWVTAKSGKTYNANWDLTKGAKLPTTSKP
jgi:hypothetical protein